MANHELVLGQSSDLALGQNHNLVMGLSQRHGFGLDHPDLGLGQTHDHHDLGLGHHHHHQHQHHHPHHRHQEDLENANNELALGQTHDPDGLAVTQSHELSLSDNQELTLTEAEIDQNHLDHLDHSHELALQPAHEMSSQSQLVVPSILQSRVVVNPNHELSVGQEFPDVKSCRRALRDAAIAYHFEIQTVKSDKTRFTAKCAAEGCPWRIHAAKLPGVPTFTIRTIHETHTCSGINHLGHQQASVQWVANSVEERLRENPHYKPKEILEEIHRMHGITLSYKQAWRGKERIMAAVRGSFEEGYRLLPQYCEQVKRTNPGSIASVEGNPEDNCFQRLFISFYASIYGFVNACRPLIGLDRTLLKSKYLGTLLLATGFDGDGALFPLAFGVVDEESDENWIWFLHELHQLLDANTENMPRLTILSDRQKGIVDGVDFNFPTAFHGFCMRHLSDSFRKEFNNPMLVNLLWEAAHALTVIEFEAKILEIEEISQDAAYWIRRIPPRLWATAYFEGTRYGHLTANIAESLNSWIIEASGLPIIQMMECIRRQLMTWFNERRETSMQWSTILVPTAERKVSEALERARAYQVGRANEAEFEVVSPQEGANIVDIRNRCCLCRGWQLYGLPCAHGVAALLSCRQNVHRYTESCFTVTTYRKTYSQTIHPIPDKSLWKELSSEGGQNGGDKGEILINPPKSLRPPGRLTVLPDLDPQSLNGVDDKYLIDRELGRGEFGVTYLCMDRASRELLACKSISKRKLKTQIDIDDVRREVAIMNHLPKNPSIVSLREACEDESAVHLVMELCEGGELFDRIVARGHYTERAAAGVTRTIVEVVQLCHKHGVIHRDLKPENFLFANKKENSPLKAIDFGLSIFFKPGERFSEIVGSPYYMAPEVLKRNYGPEIDIWSAGVILYILLCGVPPFWAESEQGVAQAILRGLIDFKREPWPSVSESAKNLVRQMLEPDPKLRLTAKQVLEHPWLQNAKKAPNVPLGDVVKSRLKQFSVMNRFKRRALRVIADHLCVEEVGDIKEMFKKIDTDNDGIVSCDELKLGLTKFGSQLAESEVQMLIEAVDTSGKGTLDYAEFLAVSLHLLRMANDEHLRRAFSYFDKDGNGYIEAEELQEALTEDGAADSKDIAIDILHEVDVDKDGKISYDEFVAMMKTGTDWRKASRHYSRGRFNSLSIRLMKDGSLNQGSE